MSHRYYLKNFLVYRTFQEHNRYNNYYGIEGTVLIDTIKICGVASYKKQVNINAKKLNFIFGSNGSGKTTLSNVLGGHLKFDGCTFSEVENDQILVYNKKFVEKNFSSDVPGIFTLGEESVETKKKISELKSQIKDKQTEVQKKNSSISKLYERMSIQKTEAKDVCWTLQQTFGNQFPKALVGFRNNKETFFNGLLSAWEETKGNQQTLSLDTLLESYSLLFRDDSSVYETFSKINLHNVISFNNNVILQKHISGSSESQIGTFIDYLQNSDWVRAGKDYIDDNRNECPFCQQSLPTDFRKQLEEYFDETFQEDVHTLNTFISSYNSFVKKLILKLTEFTNKNIPFLKFNKLMVEITNIETLFKLNMEKLSYKSEHPNELVELESLIPVCEHVNEIIDNMNNLIERNNLAVRNQKEERNKFKKQLWTFLAVQAKITLDSYKKNVDGTQKGIDSISKRIAIISSDTNKLIQDSGELERTLTSVTPTIEIINRLLNNFGFQGFKLTTNTTESSSYKIIRSDGSDAKKTLSEGEYNFITFLYFYYLIYGSQSPVSDLQNKVIVIDDPISSLDSGVLFIVSSLVKKIIDDCRNNKDISQVFVLTHNLYFYKEATFLGSREKYKNDEVLYGRLIKNDEQTALITYAENPVQSSYELLWKDIKDENSSSATCFNSMRRVLEHYFKVMGGVDYEKCIDEFEGVEKICCKSLISVINDGSHFISDDFVIQFDAENINRYKIVFKKIFIYLNQENHYLMMMK